MEALSFGDEILNQFFSEKSVCRTTIHAHVCRILLGQEKDLAMPSMAGTTVGEHTVPVRNSEEPEPTSFNACFTSRKGQVGFPAHAEHTGRGSRLTELSLTLWRTKPALFLGLPNGR
uniref:Uncharacterized protein n=1 Tax=Rhodosorus marinus TaxID=101924 RepID=A0A7S3A5D6_9RHOD